MRKKGKKAASLPLVLSAGASPSLQDVTTALQAPFLEIDKHYDEWFDECDDDQQRAVLKSLRDAARDAYWKGVVIAIEPGNAVVTHLYEELKQANDDIEKKLGDLQNILEVIGFLTSLIKLAASLATLVGV